MQGRSLVIHDYKRAVGFNQWLKLLATVCTRTRNLMSLVQMNGKLKAGLKTRCIVHNRKGFSCPQNNDKIKCFSSHSAIHFTLFCYSFLLTAKLNKLKTLNESVDPAIKGEVTGFGYVVPKMGVRSGFLRG